MTGTPLAADVSRTSMVRSRLSATGFSMSSGTPASRIVMASGWWTSVAAAITTPSTPARSGSSGCHVEPCLSARALPASGLGSTTPASWVSGDCEMTRACSEPMLPAPIRRMLRRVM